MIQLLHRRSSFRLQTRLAAVRRQGQAQPLHERNLRFIAEFPASPRNVGLRIAHVPGPRGTKFGLNMAAEQLVEMLYQIKQRDAAAIADVIHVSHCRRRLRRLEDCLHGIRDVRKIPRL